MSSMRQLIDPFKKVNKLLSESKIKRKIIKGSFVDKQEVDSGILEEYGFDYEDDIEVEIDQSRADDVEPLNIDKMLELIQGFKSKGATHIYIEPHIDHQSYILRGYKLDPPFKKKMKKIMDID